MPDANTIWTFREALTRAGGAQRLFELFDRKLRAKGYLAMSGQLVDASIVSAPKQRTNKAEKQAIKEGRVLQDWQDRPAKLRQKDRDARWTVKTTKAKARDGETPMVDLAIPAFGDQNHISTDRHHRLIRRWLVPMRAPVSPISSTPRTPPQALGPTPATAPERTRTCSASGCS